jgi:Tfp pilus assembly protein PilX
VTGFTGRNREGGASLLLALLLLALLGGLVTHALQANQWQRRIASHEIASARAETAARSALRWAEQWLMHLPGDLPPDCTGPCDPVSMRVRPRPAAPTGLDSALELGESWWLEHAYADGFDPLSGRLLATRGAGDSPAGRWIVIPLEHADGPAPLSENEEIRYYRILARAVPARRGNPVLIETVVARPWGDARWRDALPAGSARFCATPGAPRPCGRLRWQQRP